MFEHGAVKPATGYNRYKLGFKMCSSCDAWIKHDGTYCPCCGVPLRTKARTRGAYRRRAAEASRY